MSERPICFREPSADAMVQAILRNEKTQTRRPMVPQPTWRETTHHLADFLRKKENPFGQAVDHLWVRECWGTIYEGSERGDVPFYRADYEDDPAEVTWRPSIHMPRRMSRITLLVTRIWVERLQDITEAGAQAEGFERREHFIRAWDSIYAARTPRQERRGPIPYP